MSSILSSVRNALPWRRGTNDQQQYPLLNVGGDDDTSRFTESTSYNQNFELKNAFRGYAPLSTATSSEALLPELPTSYSTGVQNHVPRQKRPQWRRALLLTTSLAGFVLILNTIWMVVVVTKCETKAGVATLYEGSCSTSSRLNTVLHIAINFLSTALLGASNYTMQCLNSPTRDEVDRAHARGKWLSVGLTNMKNLAYLPKRRVILFIILFLSTWPLHFVWNSIIFSTRQTNLYSILVVAPDFLSSDTFNDSLKNVQQSGGYSTFHGFDFSAYKGSQRNMSMANPGYASGTYTGGSVKTGFNSSSFLSFSKSLYQKSRNSSLQRLDPASCMKEYSATFLSNQRNLFVVVKTPVTFPANQTNENGSILAFLDSSNWNQDLNTPGGLHWNPSAWICSTVNDSAAILMAEGKVNMTPGTPKVFQSPGARDLTCNTDKALSNFKTYNNWTIASQFQNSTYEVDYCMSETVTEECQVQFSVYLMIIVLVCNVCKFFCMLLTHAAFTKSPLVVLGDAIASFLSTRDVSSEGLCLFVGPHAEGGDRRTEIKRAKEAKWSDKPKMWSDVARGTWMTLLIMVLGALSFGIAMIYKGSQNLGLQSFNSLSFGSVNPSALLFLYDSTDEPTSESGWLLLKMVMIANCPQIYFSVLYFLYNRSYTAMLAMAEWTRFSLERKSLRVSNPVGIQRSTYWLQLPYLYSVPLLVGSGLVHWILSESLFLVRISFFDRTGQPTFPTSSNTDFTPSSNTLTVPGYSPKAILAAIIVSAIMLAVLIWNEFRAYKSAIPLVVNSSFAISAACHRPDDDVDAAHKRVMWGAVSQPDGDLPGHCCITSHEVEPPIVGEHYE